VMSLHGGKRQAAAGASSSGSAAAGKGHSDWVSLAAKVLQRQEHSRKGWRHERSNSEKQVRRAVEEKQQFAKEEKTIKREASYQEGKSKKDVPFGSRKNPMYVRGERQRDAEADADFKKLELIRETKQAEKKERKAASARVDRTAQADKYLKVMEKPVLKKAVHKHADRNQLAAKYLHELIKHKHAKPHGSRAAAAAEARALSEKQYELARDAKAERDMKLLKKGVAVVKKGSRVEKVKLDPTVVKGVNVVEQEKKKLTRPKGPDRNALAQKYLQQLKLHPIVGKPFHAYPVPKPVRHRADLNAKAQHYLKKLEAAQKKPVAKPHHVDRNVVAEKDLHKLAA